MPQMETGFADNLHINPLKFFQARPSRSGATSLPQVDEDTSGEDVAVSLTFQRIVERVIMSFFHTVRKFFQQHNLNFAQHSEVLQSSVAEEDPSAAMCKEDIVFPQLHFEGLLRAIRDATHEAERWHALPLSEHNEDTLDQVQHLKELHSVLKRFDRENGIRRDRIQLAIRMNDFVS